MLAVTACSSAYRTTADDDIYYTPNSVRGGAQSAQNVEDGKVVDVVNEADSHDTAVSEQEVIYEETAYAHGSYDGEYYTDEIDGPVIINNYYGDYYDFSYASRIRRFHRPYASFGYYDPFFTNMYFYTHNPMYYGVSIYMGYGAAPFYYPGHFMMSPWYSSWHWYPYASWYGGFYPSAYWMWGWRNTYWAGYHHGFYSGLYAGMYHPYGYWGHYSHFYNSHDGSNYHYGPRGSMGSTVDRSTYGRHTGSVDGRTSFAERFEARTAVDDQGNRVILAENRTGTALEAQTSARRESSDAISAATGESTTGRTAAEQVQERVREHTGAQESATASRYTTPDAARATAEESTGIQTDRTATQRYTRPQQVSPQRQTDTRSANYTLPRTYTAPSYQQPSTPQRTRPASTTAPANQTRPSGDQARPAQPTQRPSTQPSRTGRGQPSYSPPRQQPSRTTTSPPRSSTPSRSTTSPARSTPPRSSASPARSTPSRGSSPARSSSGSSGSSSRSSSSSGGRNR